MEQLKEDSNVFSFYCSYFFWNKLLKCSTGRLDLNSPWPLSLSMMGLGVWFEESMG